ncbi:MAG: hypothetical protein LBR53_09075 [Deltaproteobacteria bacterium]|nr:hypothetical protein [Deltaproteobacteria bacterium]
MSNVAGTMFAPEKDLVIFDPLFHIFQDKVKPKLKTLIMNYSFVDINTLPYRFEIDYNINTDKINPYFYPTSFQSIFRQTTSWLTKAVVTEAMIVKTKQDLSYILPELEVFRSAMTKFQLLEKYDEPSFDAFQNEITFREKEKNVVFYFSQLST